ncbi:putative multidrug resistance protein [Bienertia sinuspersici]
MGLGSMMRGGVQMRMAAISSKGERGWFEGRARWAMVPAGETLALVGVSGSGKSTAVALFQRFYNPLSGEILLDGVTIDKLQLKWLRSQMGLVSQEPALFATTIKENILFGKEDATMEEVIEAAIASNAHNFISQLPLAYDTKVGERGVQMSGGQKQRIAIARAIIKKPRVLLLDEATSALDSESERVVQEALDKAAVGQTTIVISHRVSTIRDADTIAVIQNGQGEEKVLVPSFRRILALNLPEWKQATLGGFSAMLFGAVQPVYSFAMGSMISVYFLQDNEEIKRQTTIYASCFLGLAVFSLLVNIVQHYNFAYMGEFLTKRVRERMLSKMLTFEVGWFDRDENSTGTICSRLAKDANVAIKAQNESSKLAVEAVSNLRTVTAFSSQARILAMFEKAQEGPQKESLMSQGLLTAKELFENFMILVNTGRVIADAGSMTTDLAKGADAVGSVFAVLDRVIEIDPDNPEGYVPEKITGHIEIRDVYFSYPTRLDVVIFKGFSIDIEAGKSTALVGPNGSGKSTIIGFIERFYDPIKGCVKVDGRDIRAYNLSDLIDESETIEASMAANARDFISGLKDGYDTWCGDRGVQISGGQKQRIAIARAILRNPTIFLLDEATSALDSQSEKIVQDALERDRVGSTSVVVAHRLSTIQNCDLIVVLDKGKAVEKGTHSSLLGKGPKGPYYSLVNLQRTPTSFE